MAMMKPSDLPTADQLDQEENDFVRQGDVDVCKHCGAVKEGTATFFVGHYRDCVEPRRGGVHRRAH